MKRVVPILIIVAIGVTIYFVLQNNKEKAQAALPKQVVNPSVPVRVIRMAEETVTGSLSLTGTVQAYRDVQLLSETSGRITKMNADIGDYLPQGAVLLQVDDAVERAAYRSAEVGRDKAKLDYDRYANLRKQNVGTQAQLDNYEAAMQAAEAQLVQAREILEDKRVRVPFGGTLTSREVQFGSVLAPGTPIGNFVDITRLKVRVDVPEEQVFRLKKGSPAQVSTAVYPGVTNKGVVDAISVKGDANHTYSVDVVLPNNKQNPLKAGMFARVDFGNLGKINALTLPREAIVGSSRTPRVYVVRDSIAVLRDIELGQELGGTAFAVRGGLQPGDLVVISGQINLTDSTRVNFSNPAATVQQASAQAAPARK